MILVKPSFEIMEIMSGLSDYGPLFLIENAGRTCYKSESEQTVESTRKFIQKILKSGHESVIEHSAMTVRIICDRGVTHEIVRHRLCAFSQESTRYCNYKGGVTFVIPPWVHISEIVLRPEYSGIRPGTSLTDAYNEWYCAMKDAEVRYLDLLKRNWSPQQARSVLPNSTKTEIVVTANFREWRHIFKLRCSKAAHPQMQEIMVPLRDKCKELVPVIFDDV